ncbi:MAG: sulfate ABC transporter permease subunit CysT, partial [Pseudomonadota bacterium]
MTALSSAAPPLVVVPDLPAGKKRAAKRVLPGFGLTLGYTVLYLSLIVLIPIS